MAYKPHSLDSLSRAAPALEQPLKELAAHLPLRGGEIGTDARQGIQAASYQAMNHFRATIVPLIRQALPGASVVPADCILSQLKSIKTSTEIDQLRKACRLAGIAFAEARRAVAPGRRENEVAAESEAAFAPIANDGFERGEAISSACPGLTRRRPAGAYARTRRRVVEDGDLVMIHANTSWRRIWTDITRTYIAGKAFRRSRADARGHRGGPHRGLGCNWARRDREQVDKAARGVLKRHGFGRRVQACDRATAWVSRPRIPMRCPAFIRSLRTY